MHLACNDLELVSERAGGRVGPEFSSLTIVMGYYKSIKKE